jgi:hypothetical protein
MPHRATGAQRLSEGHRGNGARAERLAQGLRDTLIFTLAPRGLTVLVIRSEQMHVLGAAAFEQFKVDMLRHLARFAPELHALHGDEVFRQVVDDGLARAARHGFGNRGPLRFFLECMVAYGAAFDTDVQIPGLTESLAHDAGNGEQWKADQAFAAIERYQIRTRGRDNGYAIAALRRLGPCLEALEALDTPGRPLEPEVLRLMTTVHPEKASFLGRERLQRLLQQAEAEAARWGCGSGAGTGLLCGLMFALGHGVTRDPLYPWVQRSLAQPPEADAAHRIESLRRKTRRYLAATLQALPAA